jgi:Caspase domain
MIRFFVLCFAMIWSACASAEGRYALLIGNEAYDGDLRLERPHEDVNTIRDALVETGWPRDQITVLNDAGLIELDHAINAFALDLARSPDSIGFFYFSGHGGSLEQGDGNQNFLIPTGGNIRFAEDLRTRGYRLSDLLSLLESASAQGIFVVVDACRNVLPTRNARGSEMKGLMRAVSTSNIYLAFATADGALAPDDGLYATILADEIAKPGQDANTAFFNAANRIQDQRGSRVRPVLSPARVGSICFAGCKKSPISAELVAFGQINECADARAFLQRYPDSAYRPQVEIIELGFCTQGGQSLALIRPNLSERFAPATLEGVALGASLNALKERFGPPALSSMLEQLEVSGWALDSGDYLSVTTRAAEVHFVEYDWGGQSAPSVPIFDKFVFGKSTLAEIREHYGYNGFFFMDRSPYQTDPDGVATLNSYPIGGGFVTFVTKISASDDQVASNKNFDEARLVAIILASNSYAGAYWGEAKTQFTLGETNWFGISE